MQAVGGPALVLLAGCHTMFGVREVPDAGPPGDGLGGDARVCSPGEAFGPGTEVPIDGIYSVEAARFAPDLSYAHLSLCPADGDKVGCDIYRSELDPATGLFTDHNAMSGVSTAGTYDSYPTPTPDGRYIIFGSRRSTTTLQLWVAEKQNGSFDAPTIAPLPLVANQEFANEAYLLPDGDTLYFAAGFSASNPDYDLYRATGGPPLFGGTAEVVASTVTAFNEHTPVVSSDELELFFASNRQGSGEVDIYVARRDSPAAAFGAPLRLSDLSTASGNDWPVWLSPDGCALYYIGKVGMVATLYVTRR